MDACDVSQFELQVRTLAGLPLTQPRQHSPAVMLNLLGDIWSSRRRIAPPQPDWAGVLALPGTAPAPVRQSAEPRRAARWATCNITGRQR
jgi:5-(carboxyamino)imidazole ribonucleotide synthase